MSNPLSDQTADVSWRRYMKTILADGKQTAPRGQPTLEVLGLSATCELRWPLLTSRVRKLNYGFAAAEAHWVLSGDNRVAPLAAHVERMNNFSDDGVTLRGAYGPPVVDQLPWCVDQLLADRQTRQATLTTWRPRPSPSKDIPCTVAMTFSIRQGRLFQHVYMRSSDGWLGLPYDLFTFAMIGVKAACEYNRREQAEPPIGLGQLTVTATSAHLYERDLMKVEEVLRSSDHHDYLTVPEEAVKQGYWNAIELCLRERAQEPGVGFAPAQLFEGLQ